MGIDFFSLNFWGVGRQWVIPPCMYVIAVETNGLVILRIFTESVPYYKYYLSQPEMTIL